MNIQVYENILNGLKKHNNEIDQNYGNSIVSCPTTKPTYPLTVFEEIRNVANFSYNGCFDKVASVGYRVDIYAKTKGNVTKQTIARSIAKFVDEYLTTIGLTRVSFNVNELENDGSIYHIIMTYSGNLHENKNSLI